MSPKKDKKKADDEPKAPKIKRIKEDEIFATARKREEAAARAAAAVNEKIAADKVLIDQILRVRKLGSLETPPGTTPFTRITVVAPAPVAYNGDDLKKDLKPAQIRAAYDRDVNLNALSPDARKRVLDVLTKEELAAVTTESLNTERLSQAVQTGIIDAKVVAKHSFIREIAPSIRISHGSK